MGRIVNLDLFSLLHPGSTNLKITVALKCSYLRLFLCIKKKIEGARARLYSLFLVIVDEFCEHTKLIEVFTLIIHFSPSLIP